MKKNQQPAKSQEPAKNELPKSGDSFTAYSLAYVNGYYAPVKHVIVNGQVETSITGVEDLGTNTLAKIGRAMMQDLQAKVEGNA